MKGYKMCEVDTSSHWPFGHDFATPYKENCKLFMSIRFLKEKKYPISRFRVAIITWKNGAVNTHFICRWQIGQFK